MISFFAVPKPFTGHIGTIQHNAITSWLHAAPGVQIILFGDESGTADAAAEIGALHVKHVRRSSHGAPLADDVFRDAAHLATHATLCFVNADIMFRGNVPAAVATAATAAPFLMIGESADMSVRAALPFDRPDWRSHLPLDAKSRGPLALDFFFFSRKLFEQVPPFALGRARFDNWLVWRALSQGAAVIDATSAVDAVHQRHDYSHLSGGRQEAYRGPDALSNQALAGLWCYLHLHSVLDAPFVLAADGLRRRQTRFTFLRQIWLRSRGLVSQR